MAQFHKILIQLPGCNEFTEKFPGGSPAAAKELAESRYPNARRVEWKGSTMSDAEQARSDKWFADYEKSVQDTYARQSAATHQHQLQHDARSAAPSVSVSTSDGPGLGGFIATVIVFGPLALLGAVFGGDKDAVTAPAPAVTAETCSRYLSATECAAQFPTADRSATPVELETPCAIWANANPALAANLTPADTCYGF